MKGYIENIEKISLENTDFRRVLYTAKHCQLVIMSIAMGEDIGEETHQHIDQFIRVEAGVGSAVLDGEVSVIGDGSAIIIPAGTKHNIINTGQEPLKLYTLYAPPEHKDGVVRHTKAEALAIEEHFDGKTTE
jgi:mannose-6-phosphate isomerase-like protein (cupin superfamily)